MTNALFIDQTCMHFLSKLDKCLLPDQTCNIIKDPKEFWTKLKQLGQKSKKGIPIKVYDDSKNIVCDKEQVLEK